MDVEIDPNPSPRTQPGDRTEPHSAELVSSSSGEFDVTLVIPTRNEAGNVDELLRRLDDALGSIKAEVLFVDDSDDQTPAVIRAAAARSRRDVRLLHREAGRRDGRLGGAVIAGFHLARAPWAVVIDGDLQHPPEIVPALIRAGLSPEVDLVYGTRYNESGDAGGLNGRGREWISTLSTALAKAVFPRKLRGVSDPMSGCFAVRLSALNLPELRPAGYKVLLEILAESRLGGTVGVPYSFQPRFSGESKASLAEGGRFLLQLLALRLGLTVGRLTQLAAFLAVGVSGVGINSLALWCLSAHWFNMPYLSASVLATNIAIIWNFTLLETCVFRKVRRRSFTAGLARFWLVNMALLPVQLGLLALLVEGPGLDPVVANVVALTVVFVLRYVLTSTWVYSWSAAPTDVLPAPSQRGPAHSAPRGGRHRSAPPAPGIVNDGAGKGAAGTRPVSPPSDNEKYHYIKGPQHRWFFWAHVAAFIGIALSLYGFSRMTYWTLVLLLPLGVYLFELILGARSSTFRRTVTLIDHQLLVEFLQPAVLPSVDVFLPTAGEPLDILRNTYGYVSGLTYDGPLTVYVLDDLGRDEVEQAARAHGFGYFARPGNEFKKAGNLQYAFERTEGDHIVIFDADFVPRPEFCTELVPYMDDETVGIVQSPQIFETPKEMHWLERAAGATQELFYRFIQPSRNAVGAAICVGTSAIYRRKALTAIGGFPQISHSEDVYTGFEMAKIGYRLQYVPVNLSRGICPNDIDSYISQQYRWCEGSMAMVKDAEFHTEPAITIDQRVSFWSGFTYYASTAMNAFFAPIPAILMFWVFPEHVLPSNYVPLAGLAALWFIVYPSLLKSRWRLDVLRVQAIYSFTHAVAIYDVFFGKTSEWIPSHGKSNGHPTPLATRVRTLMVSYIGLTQFAIFAGLVVHMLQYDTYAFVDWSAALAFSFINAYIFLPVAWLCIKAFHSAGTARREPHVSPALETVSAP